MLMSSTLFIVPFILFVPFILYLLPFELLSLFLYGILTCEFDPYLLGVLLLLGSGQMKTRVRSRVYRNSAIDL